MRHVADRPGLTAGQVPDPGSVELLVDLLLLHRLAQLPVLPDGHDHRHHLAALTNHVVVVTGGEFAHEGHGNEVDRQPDVTTRRRSTIKLEALLREATGINVVEPDWRPRIGAVLDAVARFALSPLPGRSPMGERRSSRRRWSPVYIRLPRDGAAQSAHRVGLRRPRHLVGAH